jgi:hypothetical protein
MNAPQVVCAIDLGIIEKLHAILSNNEGHCSMESALNVLHFIANDFKGSQCIARNGDLLTLLVKHMKTRPDLEGQCADIFSSLSAVPLGKQHAKTRMTLFLIILIITNSRQSVASTHHWRASKFHARHFE